MEARNTLTTETIMNRKTTRRIFLTTAAGAGLASPLFTMASRGADRAARGHPKDAEARQARLLEILRQPVLKQELFASPVIIQSVEQLLVSRPVC
jgi:hypothetical protein